MFKIETVCYNIDNGFKKGVIITKNDNSKVLIDKDGNVVPINELTHRMLNTIGNVKTTSILSATLFKDEN